MMMTENSPDETEEVQYHWINIDYLQVPFRCINMLIGNPNPLTAEDREGYRMLYDPYAKAWLFGIAMLAHWQSSVSTEHVLAPDHTPGPVDGLQFVGWLPADASVWSQTAGQVSVPTNTITALVAVFEATKSRTNLIPENWLSSQFSSAAGDTVRLHTDRLLPLPYAIETAHALAGADIPRRFLSAFEVPAARADALKFRADCNQVTAEQQAIEAGTSDVGTMSEQEMTSNELNQLKARVQSFGYDISTFTDQIAFIQAQVGQSVKDLELLLAAATGRDREMLVGSLRDVITDYPATLHGVPAILVWASRDICTRTLPITATKHGDLELLGWLPPDSLVLSRPPAPLPPLTVPVSQLSIVIAVFRSTTGAPPTCPTAAFWSDLFADVPKKEAVRIHSPMLLPLPDAVEAARVMIAGQAGDPGVLHFLSNEARTIAQGARQKFLEQSEKPLFG